MKDYRIEVKVKNNILYKLMKGKGIENVAELARISGVSISSIYDYMNLKVIPYLRPSEDSEFKLSAIQLADFLGVTPYDMFPLQHLDKPLPTNKAESELTFEEVSKFILPGEDKPLLEDGMYSPEQVVYNGEKRDAISKMLKTLSKNEETALRMYFGFDGPKESYKEIGKYMERKHPHLSSEPLTTERVRMIIAKGLRKMRHEYRSDALKEFI